ncbi:hypothetical protein FEF26_12745 [Nesterenkonia salmonea]|uniref:Type ISP restriction-modification enzyme LLaBIII C-terminal specificity domain-containing protein n=2 Tax=Nesterenkonia salmonea TaxID=1804987 RepID=A0A5R9B9G9_9MICC|nr:hypothetical protein FEF26_12745 [Nesterenkonia salmonea]
MRHLQTVHITFTGTGTFIVRLLQSGVITPHDLARKYSAELHANEIMLLAYYIAAINIEATYHGLIKDQTDDAEAPYVPFEGIVLGDTFQMTEEHNTFDLEMFTSNNTRAKRQLDTDIRVIIGNPPYSAGQTSANDNNANASYPSLDARIRDTYAAQTTGQNKNSLYDSYIRAIRWGTDRIGDRGILAYVSNGGYIDSNSANGLRKTFVEDFDQLFVYNLRGHARGTGEDRRKEKGNVFGGGTRTTVAIMLGVIDPAHTGDCVLHYRDIGDYLTREDKLAIVNESTIISTAWETITPNSKGEWINQSSDTFDTLPPLGDKKGDTGMPPIFTTYSAGVKTNRDTWCYNFSHTALAQNMNTLIDTYNHDVETFQPTSTSATQRLEEAKAHATYDDTRIKWNAGLLDALAKRRQLSPSRENTRIGTYRPFAKQFLYFDSMLNERTYQLPSIFPTPHHPNHGFYLTGAASNFPFAVLAVNGIPDLHHFDTGQFFPRYTWEPVDSAGPDLLSGLRDADDQNVVDGHRRIDNITDATLTRYRHAFGSEVTKDEIFAHLYALLHSEQYRTTFAAELKRQLPRMPLPESSSDFWTFAESGQKLLDLHINYEAAEPYPLNEEVTLGETAAPGFYRVQKMKWGGPARSADKSRLIYNTNITLTGIPEDAHEYMLGSRSALEWLIDRYQVKTDKASGIVNDPNDWASEQGNPRYILDLVKKITTVSVETVRLTQGLPPLLLQDSGSD